MPRKKGQIVPEKEKYFTKLWRILDQKKNLYEKLASLSVEQRELLKRFEKCNGKLIPI